MSSLSQLPDLCLLALFKHIPLVDVIRMCGRVCSNWSKARKEDLMHRRALVILDEYYPVESLQEFESDHFGSDLIGHVRRDDDGSCWARPRTVEQIEFDALRVPGEDGGFLTEGFTSPLMELMPNVTHLTVGQSGIPADLTVTALTQVTRLINHYDLISLKLDFYYNLYSDSCEEVREQIEITVHALFESINQLESLQHLTLSVYCPNMSTLPELSILSRPLVSFNVKSFEPERSLIPSLNHHATQVQSMECDVELPLEELLQRLEPQLARNFTRIRVKNRLSLNSNDFDNMKQFKRKKN